MSLKGKRVLITGANAGIGKETAAGLAKLGATIVLACRSRERAETAIGELVARGLDKAAFEFVPLDLASLTSVDDLVTALRATGNKFDVVIANGGMMVNEPLKTSAGFEYTFGLFF
jgi:NAD(P)-dependent dehydrogenase (short-subunit alcohol dehydrogenase family)